MSGLTIFLARFVGLLAVLLAAIALARGNAEVKIMVAKGPVLFVLALIGLAAGLAMILGHNVWSGGVLPVAVTVVGWLIFAKGLLLFFLKSAAVTAVLGSMQYGGHSILYTVPALAIGLSLSWAGFTTPFPRTP
jgi:hypothetical protein